MDVKMIEVYQVEDYALKSQWRKKPLDSDIKRKKDYLATFKPLRGLDLRTYNILFVGVIGSGKSSFCNTLTTVFAEKVKLPAPTADEQSASITNQVCIYSITDKDGNELALKFYDIRGFDERRNYEHELEHLLDGRLPENYAFPDNPIPVDLNTPLKNPKLKARIHLVCFIADITKLQIQEENDALHKSLNEIKVVVRRKGLPLLAVVTKMDQLCPKIAEDAECIYDSPKAYSAVASAANILGLSEKQIFPVVNYSNDRETSAAKDRLAVEALYEIVTTVEHHLEQHPARKKEDPWMEFSRCSVNMDNTDSHEQRMHKFYTELSKLQDYELRVLCAGAVNSGKSSFIDSVYTALTGRITSKVSGGITHETSDMSKNVTSKTEKFQLFPLKCKHPTTGQIDRFNVLFGDMPGFQKSVGFEQIKMIINGQVPNMAEINVQEQGKFLRKPEKNDKMHVVCLVIDITSVEDMPKETKTTYIELTNWLVGEGIPFIVIVTKSDKLSKAVANNTLKQLKNEVVKEKRSKLIELFKFKENKLFPVRNYVHERRVDPEIDAFLFDAILEIVKLGEEYLTDSEDERENTIYRRTAIF